MWNMTCRKNSHRRNSCLHILLVVALVVGLPINVLADDTESPEAQRFKEAKVVLQRGALSSYISTAKTAIDQSWQQWKPPASGKLLITKLRATVDANGTISRCDVVKSSGSADEDRSVQECVRKTTLSPLPTGVESFKAFWTFMSDGSLNIVEWTQSDEANAYYMEALGHQPSNRVFKGSQMRAQIAAAQQMAIAKAAAQANFQAHAGGGGTGGPGGPGPSLLVHPNEPGRGAVQLAVTASSSEAGAPYMADLQRRIKRAWFPPKGYETKRVVVVFKIHRGGELSNLRLDHSSGVAVADQAALKAVENASPFRPLPAGAADDVDIQFTFDYNVFNGGGVGKFTRF